MKTDQEMVRWALEESSEPVIKNPYLRSMFAGGQLVQHGPGRPGYGGKPHGKKFTKTELNKAANWMFKQVDADGNRLVSSPHYDDLTIASGEKKKVYDKIHSQTRWGDKKPKFKVKTQAKAFSATDQAKILRAFPDAKFTATNKYGFPPDHPNYQKAFRFVERGFKLSGQALPVSVQKEIMEAFPEVKNWNWERGGSQYGISAPKKPTKEQMALYKRIETFVKDPKPIRYAFRWGEADGFMLQSMDRAFLQGSEDYIPIKELNKKGKKVIVGFIDNSQSGKGIKYYHNGYIAGGKKLPDGALLAKNHADYKALSKYVDVAKQSGANLDETSKVFRNLFPEGMDTSKIKFDDLVGFLSKEKGAKNVRAGIVKHHGAYVKTSPTKDLQILTSQLNYEADKIGNLIKKGDLSRVDDLKKLGIRLVMDDKSYGVPAESAKKGYERIVKSTVADVKKWESKDFNSFKNAMYQKAQENGIGVKKCGLKKAEGGRIGFATGTQSFDDCMRGAIADETRIAKSGKGQLAKKAAQRLVGVGKWATKWIGLVDAPIEFAFALPALLRGDIEGAKRATTFGLAGWGKTQMEQMKETNPEAYKFLKHDNDILDWQGAEWRRTQLEEKKKRLEEMNVSGYGTNELNKVNTEIEELLAKQKNIEENYKGYEYEDEIALGKQMLGSYVKNEADRHREARDRGEVLGMQKPIVDEAFGELTPTSIMPEKERKAVDYPDTFGGYLMKKQFDKGEGKYREDPIIEALIEEGPYMDTEEWRKRYMREKSAVSPAQLNAMYGSKAIQDYYGAVQSAQGFADGGIVSLLKK